MRFAVHSSSLCMLISSIMRDSAGTDMSNSICSLDDLQAVKNALQEKRFCVADIPITSDPGIYALYLTDPHALGDDVEINSSGLIYVGMTKSSLELRNHFGHKDSSFSSPRRTLGAILKSELGLTAIPRGYGRSAKDFTNYRFEMPGEERLTAWMTKYLTYSSYSFAVLECRIEEAEQQMIACLHPTINLSHWLNPKRAHLKKLRKICRDEAKRAANHEG
jgi:hypothetical protein